MSKIINIRKKNELIAEFLNFPILPYNRRWDYLMLAVEKIEQLNYRVTINFNNCYIETYTGNLPGQLEEEVIVEENMCNSKIFAVWKTIIDFIELIPRDKYGVLKIRPFIHESQIIT